jgi:pentatricopeptide repeat protein
MIGRAQSDPSRMDDLMPNTDSFNILLNVLVSRNDKDCAVRAEDWLRKMESINLESSSSSSTNVTCQPDENSFNIVLNGWSKSRMPGAAQRATDIFYHMKQRYNAGLTTVHPSARTYCAVLSGWARSRESNALKIAEGIFDEYVEACNERKWDMTRCKFTYNFMIRCYAKSRRPDAGSRAIEIFETMKQNAGDPLWEQCAVDTCTYTGVIEAITKRGSLKASERAISLLEEIESSYRESGDRRIEPSIQLYTSVVNAIAQSGESPERAQAIVDRVESSYLNGFSSGASKPDIIFYNSLMNAYGFSEMEGRFQVCLRLLHRMVDLYESKSIPDAKPDVVTFNSVLNAGAYEKAHSQSSRDAIINSAVETFELLRRQPRDGYGQPDQATYAQMLAVVANQMGDDDDRRTAMAESIFLQCAQDGLVGKQIVIGLHFAAPYSKFCDLVGPALLQPTRAEFANKTPRFDLTKLPSEWTAKARSLPSSSKRRQRSSATT